MRTSILFVFLFENVLAFMPRPLNTGVAQLVTPGAKQEQASLGEGFCRGSLWIDKPRCIMGRVKLFEAADMGTDGDSSPVKLIIAGAPASGKGTQCEKIKERYGCVHLSTGDMLRASVVAGTDVGKRAKDFMDSGKLVPDDVMIGVVSRQLCSMKNRELKYTSRWNGDCGLELKYLPALLIN
jgi:hypothetical protein